MKFELALFALLTGLFLAILLFIEIGRRMGMRKIAADPEGAHKGIGAVEGALFALFGLLVAFTFSGAAERFEERRHLIVEEANDIGTAYLRIDLLPEAHQATLRDDFRRYVDSRIATYRALPDIRAAEAELRRSGEIQNELWAHAVRAAADSTTQFGPTLALGAINAMIDITTTRTMATKIHPPAAIYGMLCVLALASALLVGYGMAGSKTRNWVHSLAFALFTVVAIHIILDLEFPRLGFIRVDGFDQVLVEERGKMDLPVR